MVFDGMTGDCLKVELRAGNMGPHLAKQVYSFDGHYILQGMSFLLLVPYYRTIKKSFHRAIDSFAEIVDSRIKNFISYAKR